MNPHAERLPRRAKRVWLLLTRTRFGAGWNAATTSAVRRSKGWRIEFGAGREDPNDLDWLVEAVRLSREIARSAPFSKLVDQETTPGNAVNDGEALQTNIVATVDAYLHPTSIFHEIGEWHDDQNANAVSGNGRLKSKPALLAACPKLR
jgi:hypothetical protein